MYLAANRASIAISPAYAAWDNYRNNPAADPVKLREMAQAARESLREPTLCNLLTHHYQKYIAQLRQENWKEEEIDAGLQAAIRLLK
jgi:hypothetical protein